MIIDIYALFKVAYIYKLEVILPKNEEKEYTMKKKYAIIILFFFCLNVISQTKVIDELDNGKFIIENNKKFAISKDTINGDFKFDTICKSKRSENFGICNW